MKTSMRRVSARTRRPSLKGMQMDLSGRAEVVPKKTLAPATARAGPGHSNVEIFSAPASPAKAKGIPSPAKGTVSFPIDAPPAPKHDLISAKVPVEARPIKKVKGLLGKTCKKAATTKPFTRTTGRPLVISNKTISHALLSSKSCYYEGALPQVSFVLKTNDVLIAPRRLIQCDHPGTTKFVDQFLIYLQYCLNYPSRRDSILETIVRSLPGSVFVLHGNTWNAVRDVDELHTRFSDILQYMLDYRQEEIESNKRKGLPKDDDEDETVKSGNQSITGRKRPRPDEPGRDSGNNSCHNHMRKFWRGLQETYEFATTDSDGFPIDLCDMDVLLSQSALWKGHEGTFYFGILLRSALPRHSRDASGAPEMVETVQKHGGRFFERIVSRSGVVTWNQLSDHKDLLDKIDQLLNHMKRLELCKMTLPQDQFQTHDVLLSMSLSYSCHFGTSFFQTLMLKIKPLFIKAEVGHVLARKIRQEIHQRGGRFFAVQKGPTSSTFILLEPNCRAIELKIVQMLEVMEVADFRNRVVDKVPFDYRLCALKQAESPPTQTDVFRDDAGFSFGTMDVIPPGNIRLMRMIRDRCYLKSEDCVAGTAAWVAKQANEVVLIIQTQGGRFFSRKHQNNVWTALDNPKSTLEWTMGRFIRMLEGSTSGDAAHRPVRHRRYDLRTTP